MTCESKPSPNETGCPDNKDNGEKNNKIETVVVIGYRIDGGQYGNWQRHYGMYEAASAVVEKVGQYAGRS